MNLLIIIIIFIYIKSDFHEQLIKIRLYSTQSSPYRLLCPVEFPFGFYTIQIDVNLRTTEIVADYTDLYTDIVIDAIGGKIAVPHYPISFKSNDIDFMESSLALSRQIKANDSIIHYLYDQNLITTKELLIEYYSSNNVGLLFLGDFRIMNVYNEVYFSFFHNYLPNDEWNIKLDYVIIGDLFSSNSNFTYQDELKRVKNYSVQYSLHENQAFKVNQPIYFSYIDEYTYSSKKFMHFLEQKYFKKYIKNNVCKKAIFKQGINGILCKIEVLQKLSHFNFIIGKSCLKLWYHLFLKNNIEEENDFELKFSIVHSPTRDKWSFGVGILRNYIINFNYETDQIGIFSSELKNGIVLINNIEENAKNKKLLILINIVIIMFGLLGMLNFCKK